ncbi:MAG: NUDIX domain-containing protein [Erysipelotrichaceae bacterium]
MNYKESISVFKPTLEQEISDQEIMLQADEMKISPLLRENKIAHYTASSMIFNHDFTKVLMIFHHIYQSYCWTGGHMDGMDDFLAVALKEAQEETGLVDFVVLDEKPISIECLPVASHIKKGTFVSAHIHMNATYALQYLNEEDKLTICQAENSDVKWIAINDLDDVVAEKDVLLIYHKIINRVLKRFV